MLSEPRRLRRRREVWVRPWLKRCPLHGQHERLMVELTKEHPSSFRNFLRMEQARFRELLVRVGPRLEKKNTFRSGDWFVLVIDAQLSGAHLVNQFVCSRGMWCTYWAAGGWSDYQTDDTEPVVWSRTIWHQVACASCTGRTRWQAHSDSSTKGRRLTLLQLQTFPFDHPAGCS